MRVVGPLHSAAASGGFGPWLNFRRTPSGTIVELRHPVRDRRSPRQISQRAAMDLIAKLWAALPLPQRLAWASLVPREAATPYHAFVRRNLARWKGYLAPVRQPDGGPPGADPAGGGLALDTAYRRVDGRVYVSVPANGLAIFFHRDTAPLFHCNGTNLIAAVALSAVGYYRFSDFPLAPGRYYYRHRYAQPQGSWSVEGTAREALIV